MTQDGLVAAVFKFYGKMSDWEKAWSRDYVKQSLEEQTASLHF
jgi:hypothetical protein